MNIFLAPEPRELPLGVLPRRLLYRSAGISQRHLAAQNFSQFAVASALLATQDAKLQIQNGLADRVAICYGTSVNGMGEAERLHEKFLEQGPTRWPR